MLKFILINYVKIKIYNKINIGLPKKSYYVYLHSLIHIKIVSTDRSMSKPKKYSLIVRDLYL